MSSINLPALMSIVMIGLFVAACNEEPVEERKAAPAQKTQAADSATPTIDPAAPRMLEPTKPGGSGEAK